MKSLVVILSIAGLLSTIGCGNKVNFAERTIEGTFSSNPASPVVEPPVVPPVTPVTPPAEPPVVVPPTPLLLKAGTCAVNTNEKVLSCLDCQSTAAVVPPPILSRKAQELLDIMTIACSIHNKSDPAGHIAPDYDELLKRVVQCSPTAYPDTKFISTQGWTIQQLLKNPVAQQNAFGGLYYNSATTDFETYFGLDIGEARYTFCRRQGTFSTNGVYPKEYYDAFYSGQPYTLPSIYVKAQKNRSDLRSCLAESLKNPNAPQQPTVPGVTCTFETAEGVMSQLVIDQVNAWQKEGHTVYYEGFNQCGEIDHPEQLLDNNGSLIKIAVKKCQ